MAGNQSSQAATTIRSGVEEVRKEPVVVTQGRTPGVAPRVQNIDNPAHPANGGTPTETTPSGTTGTTGTTGSGDTGTSGVSGGNDGTSNETGSAAPQTPPPGERAPAEVSDDAIKDILSIDDTGKQDEAIEDYAKRNGMEVSEVKRQVEKAKPTTNSNTPSGNDGRDKAGQVKGLMDDPDWGKPLDDKFDIQQGDFIEFLMKEVVLASAAWTGNKVFGVTGYGIYKVGSSAYHTTGKLIKKGWDKTGEVAGEKWKSYKKNKEKINNENLYSGALKHDDKTNGFAKKVLDARKEFLKDVANSAELKSAQALCTSVRSTIRGEMDIDNAVRGKDGRYTITRNYKDDNDKEQSEKITVDEKTYQTLMSVHQNVQKTIGERGDSPELRQAMDTQITALFKNRADMLEKEKIFAADYAASVLLERAARMTPEEIGKLKAGKEFQNLLKGEGKLAFYHHLYDIEHRKPNAFKGDIKKNSEGKLVEISALQVLSDTGHAALEQSVKKLNNSQYREAFKDKENPVPENATLNRIFIDGKSEYAPEINEMTEPQREEGLKFMQKDAIDGYNRLDQLNRQQQDIDGEISAIASDAKDAQQRKTELEQRKKHKTTDHDKGTAQRDAARTAALNNIRRNTK